MLAYAFMRRALACGIVLAVVLPLVGSTLVLRRTSMTGDALSHCSLAGVAAGLVAGVDPVVGALAACVIAALSIEGVRRRMPHYADVAIAVVAATGAGLAGILSSFAGNTRSLDDYLFGSLVSVSDAELALVIVLGIATLAILFVLRRALFVVSIDEGLARTCGVRTRLVDAAFAVTVGVVVSISARTIGSLVVSSMLVVPVAAALQVARGYRACLGASVGISLSSCLVGIVTSYGLGVRPGGAIALVGAAALLVAMGVRAARGRACRG